jgi:hypothetical protein
MATRYQRGNQSHCIVCPSSIYDFWLLLWYHVAILLTVLPPENTMATRYQRGNEKSLIEEGQTIEEGKTIQWPQDTKGVIRSRKSRRERPPLVSCGLYIIFPSSISDFWLPLWYLVAIQDTKEVIIGGKSRKDRQYNGHKIPKG